MLFIAIFIFLSFSLLSLLFSNPIETNITYYANSIYLIPVFIWTISFLYLSNYMLKIGIMNCLLHKKKLTNLLRSSQFFIIISLYIPYTSHNILSNLHVISITIGIILYNICILYLIYLYIYIYQYSSVQLFTYYTLQVLFCFFIMFLNTHINLLVEFTFCYSNLFILYYIAKISLNPNALSDKKYPE